MFLTIVSNWNNYKAITRMVSIVLEKGAGDSFQTTLKTGIRSRAILGALSLKSLMCIEMLNRECDGKGKSGV